MHLLMVWDMPLMRVHQNRRRRRVFLYKPQGRRFLMVDDAVEWLLQNQIEYLRAMNEARMVVAGA